MEFKDIFKKLLRESGMTQAEFCRKSGLQTSYVSQINTGKTPDPSFSKVCLIADTFEVSLNEISEMWREE